MNQQSYLKSIATASHIVGKTWPLYSFVTSNPLAGFETNHFTDATQKAENLFGGNTLPTAAHFKQAWDNGEINQNILNDILKQHGLTGSIENYLLQLDSIESIESRNINHNLDVILVKWLSAFMDEGLAEWEMPNKKKGFYKAWRSLAIYDGELGIKSLDEIPKDSVTALQEILLGFSEIQTERLFEFHLAALPGWMGYIKYRVENNTPWQQEYPISLEDYLAVRLVIAKKINAVLLSEDSLEDANHSIKNIQYLFLKAWEKTWQSDLEIKLHASKINVNKPNEKLVPDAQMAFCIDTRSELIRRNVENTGNYETFGYAGFFGIAMDYTNPEDGISRKSCPPIVPTAYQVTENAQNEKAKEISIFKKRNKLKQFKTYFLKRMKNMLPSAFGYVEGSGVLYGFSLVKRTLLPASSYDPDRNKDLSYEHICRPEISSISNEMHVTRNIPLEEKAAIVKGAFDLTGWNTFSPLILFVGHGSHTANNPFASSLDCGACAASPGRHNARMLANLANEISVREILRNVHQIHIPQTTVFIGAEHNTTTDEIVLFDSEVPASHSDQLKVLKHNLKKAQKTAIQERLGVRDNELDIIHKKATNWSETRPEWGLAKNAGFIVGPRSLTKEVNLEGNCFLHSYDWQLDTQGKALEGIMQGPMVVTQWINNHYYFATVDNNKYGGGTKITHNITGSFGVVQGNGGDLKYGLPLQSVNVSDSELYHKPLRLSVLIQAPVDRIQSILERNENLKSLLDNEWIYLMVMNPEQDNAIFTYTKGMQWPVTNKYQNAVEMV